MAYSLQRAVSDGTLNTIPVSIKYFDKTDISVFVDDVLLPDGTYTYAWSANNIVITPNVAAGLEVLIKRTTKFDTPYHDFSAGAVFKDSTVDDNFLQMLFIAQETSEGATQTDFYADLNFHGYRLRKVGNAVEDDDAVPFAQYKADALGAYNQRVLAEAAKVAAQASQTSAASSASSATSSASSASTSASNAATSEANALAYRNTTLGYRNETQGFRNEAEAFKNAASASASAAATSEANAASSAASINPADIVHKTGDETVGGIKTFTSNMVFSGNGLKIRGNFYDTAHTNRLRLESNSTNAQTIPAIAPNGTATTSGINCYNSSDLDNSSVLQYQVTAGEAFINSLFLGTGLLKPLKLKVQHVPQLSLDGATVTSSVPVVLPGNATSALQAVPKQQLDAAISGVSIPPSGQQEFLTSGNFTVPAGVTKVFLTGCGGGGGGGGVMGSNSGAQYGGGGGSGYTVIRRAVTVTPGASITVTVGGGGGAGSPGSGGTGGTTSFGELLSISGGGGGSGTNATGSAFHGGGGAGNWDGDAGSTTSNGGSSVFGRGASGGSPGNAAAANSGAGGGGGRTPSSGSARAGGAGGSGYLIVEW